MSVVGDRTVGNCITCRRRRDATFELRDLKLESPPITIPMLLVFVCDTCDEILGIPPQSAPMIAQARHEYDVANGSSSESL